MLAILALEQIALVVESLIEGKPFSWVKWEGSLRLLVFSAVSFLAWFGLRSGRRERWVYWLSVSCLMMWCYFTFTTDSFSVHGDTKMGSWIAFAVCCAVLIRFSLNRRNLEYFGIVRGK